MREKNFSSEVEEMSDLLREKLIEQEAEKIVNAILVLEIFDGMPPIKTNLAESFEELIRRMANHSNIAQKILRRAVQKLDFLYIEENSDYKRKS